MQVWRLRIPLICYLHTGEQESWWYNAVLVRRGKVWKLNQGYHGSSYVDVLSESVKEDFLSPADTN